MRPLIASFLILALVTSHARAADATIVRVWPLWHDADTFQSFYEYETKRELIGLWRGKWVVLRSHPEDRSGLYFLTRIKNPGPVLPAAAIVVRVIYPTSTDTKVFTFPVNVPAGKQLFEIGLTGMDWTSSHIMPVAWEVELQTPDGRVLDRKFSYLWEKPPGR